jgi:hypothetical protein
MNFKQRKVVSQGFRIAAVIFTACGCALAQYGGGTTGGATGGTYTPGSRSYGHGAAIAAIAGGAAGAGLLVYALHHRHAAVVGCVSSDGKTLNAENGKHSYQLTGAPVTAGNRVAVVGKKEKARSGIDQLEVQSVKKDYGQCQAQQASLTLTNN